MKLKDILSFLDKKIVKGNSEIEIMSITQNSRKISSGGLFAAIEGQNTDGNKYIKEAIERGAHAVVTEKEYTDNNDDSVCQIIVPDVRKALGEIASRFYGSPSEKINLIAITGTNGKTTTSYILESIFRAANKKTGIIGTIYYKIGEEKTYSTHTTPVAEEFQLLLSKMVENNVDICVAEISSHAIAQKRIWGSKFNTAIFTNLTHDHLDYHKTIEEYGNTKLELFTSYLKSNGTGIVNLDDPWADKFIKSGAKNIMTYGFSRGSNVMAFNVAPRLDGTSMSILTPEGIIECYVKLIGLYNVHNIMAAVCGALAMGLDIDTINEGLDELEPIKGRFEYVEGGQTFSVVVDYAHTPDGLQKVLETIRSLFRGRLIVVFGATGDRDKSKRPIMGKIVSLFSDIMIITSDDPHSENPEMIADEIISGVPKEKIQCIIKETDRKKAIEKALDMATPQDFILIAGKGHETKQIFKDKIIDFNDKELALKYLLKKYCNSDTRAL
ncbi:MAG: UDP-N-acetylmuramoyl-L-alanyl-D-glutamate--2,6-diaminopimelate ligase [Candidatus Firestonebacteria bacterium]|nr:UDP-N-acetylmuramoyl-L-alanyl-D-glutamate--2,6-diaminopimelate ligase [Candidatus Firestonebacteria bacterium]